MREERSRLWIWDLKSYCNRSKTTNWSLSLRMLKLAIGLLFILLLLKLRKIWLILYNKRSTTGTDFSFIHTSNLRGTSRERKSINKKDRKKRNKERSIVEIREKEKMWKRKEKGGAGTDRSMMRKKKKKKRKNKEEDSQGVRGKLKWSQRDNPNQKATRKYSNQRSSVHKLSKNQNNKNQHNKRKLNSQ